MSVYFHFIVGPLNKLWCVLFNNELLRPPMITFNSDWGPWIKLKQKFEMIESLWKDLCFRKVEFTVGLVMFRRDFRKTAHEVQLAKNTIYNPNRVRVFRGSVTTVEVVILGTAVTGQLTTKLAHDMTISNLLSFFTIGPRLTREKVHTYTSLTPFSPGVTGR